LIDIKNLTKKFGTIIAVNNLCLHIAKGEFFGFLGPNGAGKTTTIKMLTGVLKPTKGTITLNGHDLALFPQEAKHICSYIPDRPFLYEKLSGREFLHFIAGIYDIKKNYYEARMEELLRLFELELWGDELIESYSHGMRQKLVIIAALLHEPKIIIIDEPLVALDPKGIRLVKKIFKDYCQQGATIFMSTHNLSLAEELCTRIGIIHQGKLAAIGTRAQLRKLARSKQHNLEDIFLKLTEEEDEHLAASC
jgi:ABC-2 type transport system ATP-binding protein